MSTCTCMCPWALSWDTTYALRIIFIVISIRSLQDFFKFLSKNTGLNPVNLTNTWRIQDTLFVEVNSFVAIIVMH